MLYHVLKELDSKRKQIHQVYNYAGEIDAALSIHFLREKLPHFCFPTILADKKRITSLEVYHPFIFQSVPNSIDLNGKSASLTGSNTVERIVSGKAVLIYLNKGNNIAFVTTHDL